MSLMHASKIQSRVRLSHLIRPNIIAIHRFSSSASNHKSTTGSQPPIGVNAALKWSPKGKLIFHEYITRGLCSSQHFLPDPAPKPTLLHNEFSLADRVALVSGANRGIGLEMALAFVEAGARAVYCVDLPKTPGEEWEKTHQYIQKMQGKSGEGRLEYLQGDVTSQVRLF